MRISKQSKACRKTGSGVLGYQVVVLGTRIPAPLKPQTAAGGLLAASLTSYPQSRYFEDTF